MDYCPCCSRSGDNCRCTYGPPITLGVLVVAGLCLFLKAIGVSDSQMLKGWFIYCALFLAVVLVTGVIHFAKRRDSTAIAIGAGLVVFCGGLWVLVRWASGLDPFQPHPILEHGFGLMVFVPVAILGAFLVVVCLWIAVGWGIILMKGLIDLARRLVRS